ncbi:aminotransferase class V-fold PLP-dependent enzyme [Candidatus Woesearchaeota archaeon]|nr:aminotransferase class V-fold PLP-dependent enzyme [Candidatus Woesearchaeota archaeon]
MQESNPNLKIGKPYDKEIEAVVKKEYAHVLEDGIIHMTAGANHPIAKTPMRQFYEFIANNPLTSNHGSDPISKNTDQIIHDVFALFKGLYNSEDFYEISPHGSSPGLDAIFTHLSYDNSILVIPQTVHNSAMNPPILQNELDGFRGLNTSDFVRWELKPEDLSFNMERLERVVGSAKKERKRVSLLLPVVANGTGQGYSIGDVSEVVRKQGWIIADGIQDMPPQYLSRYNNLLAYVNGGHKAGAFTHSGITFINSENIDNNEIFPPYKFSGFGGSVESAMMGNIALAKGVKKFATGTDNFHGLVMMGLVYSFIAGQIGFENAHRQKQAVCKIIFNGIKDLEYVNLMNGKFNNDGEKEYSGSTAISWCLGKEADRMITHDKVHEILAHKYRIMDRNGCLCTAEIIAFYFGFMDELQKYIERYNRWSGTQKQKFGINRLTPGNYSLIEHAYRVVEAIIEIHDVYKSQGMPGIDQLHDQVMREPLVFDRTYENYKKIMKRNLGSLNIRL